MGGIVLLLFWPYPIQLFPFGGGLELISSLVWFGLVGTVDRVSPV